MLPDVQSGFCSKRWTINNLFCTKTARFSPVLNKLMQLKRVTDRHSHLIFRDWCGGHGGGAPSHWAIFVILHLKIAILTPFYSHFILFEGIWITKLLKPRGQFQRIKLLSTFSPPSLLQVKSKTRLNARILRINFLSDLVKGLKPLHSGCVTDCDLKILSVL